MSRRVILLVAFFLLIGACTPAETPPAPTETGPSPERAEPTPRPATATPRPPTFTPTPESTRTATFAEIINQVEARTSQGADFASACLGQVIQTGGEARTAEDGKARLDLTPDGTIIRVAPNTTFTVLELSGDETTPFSKIELFFGKAWVLLKGGSLEVQTPSGVASVRGSLLGVSYDPATKAMTATCLEGHCGLTNGNETIELIAGQAADIFDGALSDQPRFMTLEEVEEWLNEAPELRDFIDNLPDIPGLPGDLFDRLRDRDLPGGDLPGPRDWPGPWR